MWSGLLTAAGVWLHGSLTARGQAASWLLLGQGAGWAAGAKRSNAW